MTHPPRAHLGAVDREVVAVGVDEGDVAAELRGRDREVRRPHDAGEHVDERALLLTRTVDVDHRVGPEHRREERQALDVVPVEVREQHRGAVRAGEPVREQLALEALGDDVAVLADAGAEVEDQRLVALGLQRDARGVPAVALVPGAVTGRRPAHAIEREMNAPRHEGAG